MSEPSTGSTPPARDDDGVRRCDDDGFRRRVTREPTLLPAANVMLRHNARLLDPAVAARLNRQTVFPTVHVGDRLLVRNAAQVLPVLTDAARRHGARPSVMAEDEPLLDALDDLTVTVRVCLVPDGDYPQDVPDAWRVLQSYRVLSGDSARNDVSLDHLLTTGLDIEGVPFVGSHSVGGVPFVGSHGIGSASQRYAVPGSGGRQPVMWLGKHPAPDPDLGQRRPVVAVLDTVIGPHPWFDRQGSDVLDRTPTVDGQERIGLTEPGGDGKTVDPYEGVLDDDAGHGTFVAGLIHQLCPDARILGVQVTRSSGAVPEGDLLRALWQLVRRHRLAQRPGGDPSWAVDVVNLSLGYYHEQPQDELFDSKLLDPLLALADLGVAVVASAGNGATDRPMYPAAFTPFQGGTVPVPSHDRVPLVSVGALNPNRTVALFSNAGPWVTCYRPGAALVSAIPTDLDGGQQPGYRVHVPHYGTREDIDPDNFRAGFAVWSGTSFAAPVFAGQLLASLVKHREDEPLDDVSAAACVTRAWAAIERQTPLRRPGGDGTS